MEMANTNTNTNTNVNSKVLFSRLPQELVSQIFIYTLPEKDNSSLSSFTPSLSPLLLTQICRAWRTIALNTPRLWARFTIPDWQTLPKDLVGLVRLWLERSGEAPLDVDISLFDEDVMVLPDSGTLRELYALLREMLRFLEPNRGRIKRFRGVFPERLMREVGVSEMLEAEYVYYCGMLGDSMMLGTALGLEGLDEEEGEGAAAAAEAEAETGENETSENVRLDVGPQKNYLRTLAICGCAANIQSVRVQTQLTHLELIDLHRGGELCQETAFTLLQNMPLLKTCVLDLTKFESQEWTPPEDRRLTLEKLELLFVSWVFPADIDLLLRGISTPKLQKLGLRGTPMVAQRPWTGLHDFLEASKAPIERISLGDFSAVDAQFLRCFEHTPNLVHLTINHTELPDIIFRTLTCTDTEFYDASLLPNLQIFNIGGCEGFQLESLVKFLKSRAKEPPGGVAKLTEAAIMYCMSVEEKDAAAFEECGVTNLIVEAAEDDSVYPYARVVETHRELAAVLYEKNADEVEGGEEATEENNERALWTDLTSWQGT